TRWFRVESGSGSRNIVGAFDGAGRHVWGAAGATHRGPHRFEASFAQRGESASLELANESVSGETWRLAYRFNGARFRAGLSVARGHDHSDSEIDINLEQVPASRDADATAWRGDLAGPALGGTLSRE